MKIPKGASKSLARTFSKTRHVGKSTNAKSRTKLKNTGGKAKHKYESFTDRAGSGDDKSTHRHRHRRRSERKGHVAKKVKSAPVLSAGYSEAAQTESVIITDSSYAETESADENEPIQRQRVKHRRSRRHTLRRDSSSEYSDSDEIKSGRASYKLFLVLLFLLAVTAVIGIIFVPVGDRIAKRYSWYAYESKVSILIITFGLAATSALILVLLSMTQLGKLRRGQGSGFVIGLIVAGFIFSLVALICSWTQHSNLEAVFGEEFENLLPTYQLEIGSKIIVDRVQVEFECCGIDSYTDWQEIEVMPESGTEGFTPFSCCDMKTQRPCIHERVDEDNPGIQYRFPDDLTIHTNGCRQAMQQYYAEFTIVALSLSGISSVLQVVLFITAFFNYK